MQYYTTYDLVSTCTIEITFNYGTILPDIRHRMAPVKIILFVVRWGKKWLKEEGIKSHTLINPLDAF